MKKEKIPFEDNLNSVKSQLAKVNKSIEAVDTYLKNKDIEKTFEAAFEFANESEKLTLLARILPAYTGHPRATKLIETQMLKNAQTKIGFTKEGWFCAIIPTLLPKKSKGSPAFIRDILYPAMAHFFKGKNPIKYTDCVLVFRHVYERSRPERKYRDHDNIETNIVADILALYVLHDDNPVNCSHYYFSASGDKNETQIFVVPRDEFIDFIHAEKNMKGRKFRSMKSARKAPKKRCIKWGKSREFQYTCSKHPESLGKSRFLTKKHIVFSAKRAVYMRYPTKATAPQRLIIVIFPRLKLELILMRHLTMVF